MKMWARHWSVRFKTKDGMLHPVRYGSKDGPEIGAARISIAAEKYLKENSDWLMSVDSIQPVEDKSE